MLSKTTQLKLDSFKTLTELNYFTKFPDFFKDNWINANLETGEVINDDKKNNVFFYDDENFIKFKAVKKKMFSKTFLEITFTSKMLLEDYLQGINLTNFKKCFEFVQSKLNFNIDYNDFLENSYIYDIDICEDFHLSPFLFDNMLRKLRKKSNHNMRMYSVESNNRVSTKNTDSYYIGGQISKRSESYGQKNAPIFQKFYSKYYEMKANKFQFIGSDNLINLRRWEFTLKNKSAILSNARQINKLTLIEKCYENEILKFFLDHNDIQRNDFLERLKKNILENTFNFSFNFTTHIEENEHNKEMDKIELDEKRKQISSLTPSKLLILEFVTNSLDYGSDLKDFGLDFRFLSKYGVSATSISRLKSDIKKNFLIYKELKTKGL